MKVKLLMVFPCYSFNDDRYVVTSSFFLLILIIHVFSLFICVSLARDLSILLILKEPTLFYFPAFNFIDFCAYLYYFLWDIFSFQPSSDLAFFFPLKSASLFPSSKLC